MNIDRLIQSHDPASSELSTAQERRAAAVLERVIQQPTPTRSRALPPRRVRRIGVLALAGAAVVALAVIIPGLSATSPAVASWTPVAEPVAPADVEIAKDACLTRAGSSLYRALPNELSERRGDVVAVVSWQDDPDTMISCIVELPAGSASAGEVSVGSTGSSGVAVVPPPDGFIEGGIHSGLFGGVPMTSTVGSVGSDVSGVTIHGGGATAIATVENGRFAAWLPAKGLSDVAGPSGRGGPEPMLTYELTLHNGTVITDAEVAWP